MTPPVLILGGGLIGLAVAHRLARCGLPVQVLSRHRREACDPVRVPAERACTAQRRAHGIVQRAARRVGSAHPRQCDRVGVAAARASGRSAQTMRRVEWGPWAATA